MTQDLWAAVITGGTLGGFVLGAVVALVGLAVARRGGDS